MITKRKEQIIVNEWAALLRLLKREIGDDYRADAGSDIPSMLVTFGVNLNGEWVYQTGDNSFTGASYRFPYWGLAYLDRRSNCKELAQGAFDEAAEQFPEMQS